MSIPCTQEAVIATLRAEVHTMTETLQKIAKAVMGNGTPGLRREVDNLTLNCAALKEDLQERRAEAKESARASKNRSWAILLILIGQFVAVAMTFLQRYLP